MTATTRRALRGTSCATTRGSTSPAERADCRRHDQPLLAFAERREANVLPDVGFLIPDLDHDAHDGTLSAADTWLHSTLETSVAEQ